MNRYNFKSIEAKWQNYWEKNKNEQIYNFQIKTFVCKKQSANKKKENK